MKFLLLSFTNTLHRQLTNKHTRKNLNLIKYDFEKHNVRIDYFSNNIFKKEKYFYRLIHLKD